MTSMSNIFAKIIVKVASVFGKAFFTAYKQAASSSLTLFAYTSVS